MPSPAELRQTSRSFEWVAEQERDPHLKQRLTNHALALAQLAEKIERGRALADRPAGSCRVDRHEDVS